MYPFIGIMISVPFLSKMLHSLSDKELKLMLLIALAWNMMCTYMTVDFSVEFGFSGWLLVTWTLYFCLGYYTKNWDDTLVLKKYVIAGLGLGITLINIICFPSKNAGVFDIAPAYVLYAFGLFLILKRLATYIHKSWIQKMIIFIAKHSFTVYMIHWPIRDKVAGMFTDIPGGIEKYLARFFVCFIASLMASIILDYIIVEPIKKIVSKILLK